MLGGFVKIMLGSAVKIMIGGIIEKIEKLFFKILAPSTKKAFLYYVTQVFVLACQINK